MKDLKVYVGGQTVDQWGTFKRNKRDIIKEFYKEGTNYILVKNFEGHYNKALMYQDKENSNHYILVSYNTIVAELKGNKYIVYGYYSETTTRHINTFLEHFGIKTLSKREIIDIAGEWQEK